MLDLFQRNVGSYYDGAETCTLWWDKMFGQWNVTWETFSAFSDKPPEKYQSNLVV